jgi:hypothetical protein
MAKHFDDRTCVLCERRPSSPTGEHVWPRWLLKMFPIDDGPYTWSINGDPVLNRAGKPRTHQTSGAVKLPMCSRCNAVLIDRFEVPARQLVRSIFETDAHVTFKGAQATTVALWFVKTWLLLTHPECQQSEPALIPPSWVAVPENLYGWMINDEEPPAGLSAWIAREDPYLDAPSTRHIPLPIVVADGSRTEFQDLRMGVRSIEVSVVYHPGWRIDHPQEAEGQAVRLWPRQIDQPVDLGPLPSVAPRDMAWLKGPLLHFRDGAFADADLPPLAPDFDPMMLPPHLLQFAGW